MNSPEMQPAIPILLVDDRPENLMSLEELLSDQGYETVKATSGNDALRLCLRHDFALVLLDVQMPEIDGFETAELMRLNPKTRHIPIIFVTAGLKDIYFHFRGYDTGGVDYLSKPIEPLFLRSKVKIFAELYRQRRELEFHKNHLNELVAQKTLELRRSASELAEANEELIRRNRELKENGEELARQSLIQTEMHDQLVATEEMLRVQIGEYEASQKMLDELNRYLKTIFDLSPLPITVTSFPSGIIQSMNGAFAELFGYYPESAMGKSVLELGIWCDEKERDTFISIVRDKQRLSGFAAELKTSGGEKRDILLYCNLIEFNNEKCNLVLYLDVTEQRRMEEQISQSQKMEVVGRLAGGVAHDFNNMLTAIQGSAELMAEYLEGNSEAVKLLANIRQATSRSAGLTAKLLAFSRKGERDFSPTDINQLADDVVSLLERTVDRKIRIETCFSAKRHIVAADPAMLQNALLNLGINSRDAMPDGGVILFSTADAELDHLRCNSDLFRITPGRYVEISVKDSGTGMSRETLKHIFHPFFTTKEPGKGTGLGLSAVYNTIQEHMGSISVVSEEGKGTLFTIFLPVSDDICGETAIESEPEAGSGGVLLVDDEPLVRSVGRDFLTRCGYRVFLAENGEDALSVYADNREKISLVILDLVMPKMGGRETLAEFAARFPEARILMASGLHHEDDSETFLKLGAKGFIQKPYNWAELSRFVASVTGDN